MKIGVSSYCLDSLMEKGQMTLFEVIDWIARQGGESVARTGEHFAENIKHGVSPLGVSFACIIHDFSAECKGLQEAPFFVCFLGFGFCLQRGCFS